MSNRFPDKKVNGTLPKIARVNDVSVRTIRKWAAEGRFPTYKPEGARRLAKYADVEAYIRSQQVPVTDHARSRVDEVLAREAMGDM